MSIQMNTEERELILALLNQMTRYDMYFLGMKKCSYIGYVAIEKAEYRMQYVM